MISNERLEELIENEERNARVSNVPQAQAESQDMASLLTELKSIRQAATAGVEEVAAAIEAIVKDGENLNGCQFPFLNKRGVAAVRAELAAQAAELDRLREGCEAATFVRYGNVSFQKSLMSGKWIVFRDHHEVTEYLAGDGRESFGNAYADTIAAGWLPDSNNKGGE